MKLINAGTLENIFKLKFKNDIVRYICYMTLVYNKAKINKDISLTSFNYTRRPYKENEFDYYYTTGTFSYKKSKKTIVTYYFKLKLKYDYASSTAYQENNEINKEKFF